MEREKILNRTPYYYKNAGGVFTELIAILDKLRKEHHIYFSSTRVLNEACLLVDGILNRLSAYLVSLCKKKAGCFEDEKNLWQLTEAEEIIRCALSNYSSFLSIPAAALLAQLEEIRPIMMDIVKEPRFQQHRYYPYFSHLFETTADKKASEAKDWKKQEKALREQIEELTRQNDEQQKTIHLLRQVNKRLQSEINDLELELKEAHMNEMGLEDKMRELRAKVQSDVDRSLTFMGILEYAIKLDGYQYCNQIMKMLKDHCGEIEGATKEFRLVREIQRIMKRQNRQEANRLAQQEANQPHILNNIQNSNVFQGEVNNPTFAAANPVEDNIQKLLDNYMKSKK